MSAANKKEPIDGISLHLEVPYSSFKVRKNITLPSTIQLAYLPRT